MTTENPGRLGYDSRLLTYIAQHPDATKYELSKNVRTEAHPSGIPYATISMWIKSLKERQEIVARKLGPTRTGLAKTGYRIAPSALFWISYALEAPQLMDIIRDHESSLPVSAGLIERAIRSTGDAPKVMQAVTDLRVWDKKTSVDEYIAGLVMNVLWDLEFDDRATQKEFVVAVVRAAAEINKSVIGRRDFVSSMRELVESESKYLENATKTVSILKNEVEALSRS
jgi:acyl-homoserine lactone acylase PvdQ